MAYCEISVMRKFFLMCEYNFFYNREEGIRALWKGAVPVSVLQRVAECCGLLLCVCCSVFALFGKALLRCVCCRVLQSVAVVCVAVCCNVLRSVAVSCSVCVAVCLHSLERRFTCLCIAVSFSVCCTVCCSVLQCALQCVAACVAVSCSVFQCVLHCVL